MPQIIYYVALPFICSENGIISPGEALECPDAMTAILQAEVLFQVQGNVGSVAFSRTGDPDSGVFEDAVVLRRIGDVPDDLSMLA